MRMSRVVATLVAVGLSLTACSSGDDGGGSGGSGDAADVQAAQQTVDELTATPDDPSGQEAFTPAAGVLRIGILSCGQEATACQRMTSAAEEAVTTLGYEPVVIDGALSATGWAQGMSLLIQQGVDGIIKLAEPDNAMPTSMADAAAAGIPVVCAVCANGSSDPIADPSLANADTDYSAQGSAIAAWAIAQTDGTAQVFGITNSVVTPVNLRHQALSQAIEDCSGCTLLGDEEVTQTDGYESAVRSLVSSQLSRYPAGGLDYIVPPSDSQANGVIQALGAAGRDDVRVASFDCDASALDSIRTGGPEEVCADTPLEALAYAAADQLARQLAGQPVEDVTVPFQLITADNVPDDGEQAGFDYRSYYGGLWNAA